MVERFEDLVDDFVLYAKETKFEKLVDVKTEVDSKVNKELTEFQREFEREVKKKYD